MFDEEVTLLRRDLVLESRWIRRVELLPSRQPFESQVGATGSERNVSADDRVTVLELGIEFARLPTGAERNVGDRREAERRGDPRADRGEVVVVPIERDARLVEVEVEPADVGLETAHRVDGVVELEGASEPMRTVDLDAVVRERARQHAA